MITYRTLGDFIDDRKTVRAHCRTNLCHHSAKLDLEALARRYGTQAVQRIRGRRCMP
jgi:hypothetical protein